MLRAIPPGTVALRTPAVVCFRTCSGKEIPNGCVDRARCAAEGGLRGERLPRM